MITDFFFSGPHLSIILILRIPTEITDLTYGMGIGRTCFSIPSDRNTKSLVEHVVLMYKILYKVYHWNSINMITFFFYTTF